MCCFIGFFSALQPIDIIEFFNTVFARASSLQSAFQDQETHLKVPRVTVSCLVT